MPPHGKSVRIDLIHFEGCPNVDLARSTLRRVLGDFAIDAGWTEWDTDAPSTPARFRAYGSPTILVNDRDVAEDVRAEGGTCRVYLDAEGSMSGVPSADSIADAIREAISRSRRPQ
jgi:hypothetical protein